MIRRLPRRRLLRLVQLGLIRRIVGGEDIEIDVTITFNGKQPKRKWLSIPITYLESLLPSEPAPRHQKYRTKYRHDPSSSHEP